MEFAQPLRDAVISPMVREGNAGVSGSVEVMKEYSLLREDLDNLLEVTQWPNQEPAMKSVDSKTKAAFTRTYNKEIVLPYSTAAGAAAKKKKGAAAAGPVGASAAEDEEEEMLNDAGDDDDDDNIEADAMIKAKKPPAARKGKKEKEEEAATSSAKGKGKGKRSKK